MCVCVYLTPRLLGFQTGGQRPIPAALFGLLPPAVTNLGARWRKPWLIDATSGGLEPPRSLQVRPLFLPCGRRQEMCAVASSH